ncbi:MAG TPA: ATP-binding protein [Candidatus Baltobacteraceae bacterium]|jgi:anti-sigma regulatory factor (Ser/Thr protein kinase)|nr:ATP-binding protein [Candidatus Baltobacteraceae bacterium]
MTRLESAKVSKLRVGKHSANELILNMPARPESSPVLRTALREFFAIHLRDPDRQADLLLAVGEATSNAIEHAYRGGEGDVRVGVFVDGIRVFVEVSDGGAWREGPSLDRGRGMDIMRSLVDSMLIEQTSRGTTVRLEISSASAERTA